MYLCPIWVLNSAPSPMHSNMGNMDVTVWHCVFWGPIHLISVPRPCIRMCTCISICNYVSVWLPMSLLHPIMHTYMERWVPLCGTVWCTSSHPTSGPTPWSECVHTSVYVPSPCLTPHICFDSISILTWKDGFLCVALCVSSSQSTCGPTSWIEGVHASVHVLLSTWTPHVCFTQIAYLHGKMGSSVVALYVSSSHLLLGPHPGQNVYIHQYMYLMSLYLTPHICFTPLAYSYMERHGFLCVALCVSVCSSHSTSGPTHLFKMGACISTCNLCPYLTAQYLPPTPFEELHVKTLVPLCDIVCLSQSASFLVHFTLC